MILVFAGLFLLGVFGVLYSFDLAGYQFSSLPQQLGLSGAFSGVDSAVTGLEQGSPTQIAIIVLVAMLLIGLILLIAELKPAAPRKVRMEKGTYITRRALKEEAEAAATADPDVLESTASVKAKRGKGARVDLQAKIRRGEDANTIRNRVRERVQQDLQSDAGISLRRLKIDLNETDPRDSQVRVK